MPCTRRRSGARSSPRPARVASAQGPVALMMRGAMARAVAPSRGPASSTAATPPSPPPRPPPPPPGAPPPAAAAEPRGRDVVAPLGAGLLRGTQGVDDEPLRQLHLRVPVEGGFAQAVGRDARL